MDFCGKTKNVNISETVRDKVILTEFWTCRVVEKYSKQNFKISIFATSGGHLLVKNEKIVNISDTVRDSDFD